MIFVEIHRVYTKSVVNIGNSTNIVEIIRIPKITECNIPNVPDGKLHLHTDARMLISCSDMGRYMPEPEPLATGAEGSVRITDFFGRPAVAKIRSPKKYRVPELDSSIRSKRTRAEARLLREARGAGVRTPVVYLVDPTEGLIVMERIAGPTVKEYLDAHPENAEKICGQIGRDLAHLHDARVAHGDLTTSNMIVCPDGKICFIDFSMGSYPADDEAVGVDVRLLERAFASAHPGMESAYSALIGEYCAEKKNSEAVIAKVTEIKERGRYT